MCDCDCDGCVLFEVLVLFGYVCDCDCMWVVEVGFYVYLIKFVVVVDLIVVLCVFVFFFGEIYVEFFEFDVI